jgi:FlaA1/EpsC-like NDP-sugar epimerase
MSKTILITGVTGTLGTSLVEKILDTTDYNIIGISRDEQKQRLLPRSDRLLARLADIRDYDSICRAVHYNSYISVDLIIHLAALKCVDTIEDNILEAVKTNVLGTQNIVDFANSNNIRVCLASTDKACMPINAYGMSKGLAEKIVMSANSKNAVVRYGNVIGSRGSFLEPLVGHLVKEKRAYLTHKDMTRFWMPAEVVTNFVLEVALNDVMTGLVTPVDIKAAYVSDLIRAVAKILRVYDYEIEEIGMRPGEKIHEMLLNEYESDSKKQVTTSDNPLRMTQSELIELIKPMVQRIVNK